jgi:hypothetical protein
MKKALSFTTIVMMVITGFLLAGCDKESVESTDTIKYGTGFGMCSGYCVSELTITPSKLSLQKNGTGVKAKTCTQSFTSQQFQQLRDKIDFEKFAALDDVYGCPDCADGGSEWIEITRGGNTHRVVFEYHKEPEALKSYISLLREHVASFNDCK